MPSLTCSHVMNLSVLVCFAGFHPSHENLLESMALARQEEGKDGRQEGVRGVVQLGLDKIY